MNTKYISSVVIGILLLIVVSACGGEKEDTSANKDWINQANLDSDESIDELYEKAKEEDELVVYAQSSATENVVDSFIEEYPDINLSISKVSSMDMLEKVRLEDEGNVEGADVVFGKDTNGFWKNELVDSGIIHSYQPDSITDNLMDPYSDYPGLPIITETITVLYNNEAYDKAPIDNWWELTKPEWKGKITMKNPLEAADIQDLFLTMIQHSNEMEEAYREEFGEDIELNETKNAGYEFIKRLLENDVVLRSSMGDSVDAVADSPKNNPPVVIASTVKLRDTESEEIPLTMVENLEPKVSVPGTTKAFIVDGSPNVNSSNLFIRWLAGSDDGQGEGFSPFNNPGTFSTREDIEQDFDVPKLNDIDLWEEDVDYYYENANELRDFLIDIL